MDPKVDAYIARSTKWPNEIAAIRPMLLGAGLDEAIKWGKPCYSHDGKNIAILQEMNDFLALMFFKGALMDDPSALLVEQGPNSRSAKRIEFTSVAAIESAATALPRYVAEAIEIESRGLTVDPAPAPQLVVELQDQLDHDAELKESFEALTPGRQREYNLHFSDAKKSETRTARIEKYAAKIKAGKGMRDR